MLVPSRHLIRLTAAVVLPAALVAGVVPGTSGLALAAVAAFALVAVWDAMRSVGCLDAVGLTLPPVVRLSQGREGVLPVRFEGAAPVPRVLHAAPALPPGFTTELWIRQVEIPGSGDPVEVRWPVKSGQRGRHPLAAIAVETASPYGLWAVRRTFAQTTEFRVYPDLFRDRGTMATLFLNRDGVGIHVQRQVGQGREFEKLRDYTHADPVSDIHWKATAKRGRPVTKVFQIERTQEVYVVLDASRLTGRVSGGEPDLERSLRSGLLLAAAAERQGDLFGVVAFDSRVRSFVRSGRGRRHFSACREALFGLQTNAVTPDFADVCTTLRLRLRRRALLVFLTSLDDPVLAEDFVRSVRVIARQHLVLVVQPRPEGVHPLFTGPDVSTEDDLYSALGGQVRWQKLRLLEQELRTGNVRFTLADPAGLAGTVLRQYLDVKQRQLL